jgi:hypothetical protein
LSEYLSDFGPKVRDSSTQLSANCHHFVHRFTRVFARNGATLDVHHTVWRVRRPSHTAPDLGEVQRGSTQERVRPLRQYIALESLQLRYQVRSVRVGVHT